MTNLSPIVIGVAGGSESGKTTVVEEIVRSLGTARVTLIHHDWYYRDRSHLPPEERARINYDHPDALETSLLIEHLGPLRSGSLTRTRKPPSSAAPIASASRTPADTTTLMFPG